MKNHTPINTNTCDENTLRKTLQDSFEISDYQIISSDCSGPYQPIYAKILKEESEIELIVKRHQGSSGGGGGSTVSIISEDASPIFFKIRDNVCTQLESWTTKGPLCENEEQNDTIEQIQRCFEGKYEETNESGIVFTVTQTSGRCGQYVSK